MKRKTPPFNFDLSVLLERARGFGVAVDGVMINLPFVSVSVKPDDLERRIAREIVIRMADRRVLNAFECCDSCINEAIASLQEIRRTIVYKQVELSARTEGPLYLLLELMAEATRQFFTFAQRIGSSRDDGHPPSPGRLGSRDEYFAALEMLRAHLHRTLLQVARLADTKIPRISEHMRYDEAWQIEAYIRPNLPGNPEAGAGDERPGRSE